MPIRLCTLNGGFWQTEIVNKHYKIIPCTGHRDSQLTTTVGREQSFTYGATLHLVYHSWNQWFKQRQCTIQKWAKKEAADNEVEIGDDSSFEMERIDMEALPYHLQYEKHPVRLCFNGISRSRNDDDPSETENMEGEEGTRWCILIWYQAQSLQ